MPENSLALLLKEEIVYHYCSSSAFESIIENRCIWAADVRAMNDPREVKSSFQTVASFLEGLSFAEGSISAELLRDVKNRFEAYNKFSRFFCSSFTYSNDDLYSWLNYASRGHGFAIGIKKSFFSDFYWRDITYNDSIFREKLTRIWDESIGKAAGGANLGELCADAAIALQKACVSNKHSSWSNENEARIILPMLLVKKDTGKYFDLDIVKEILKSPEVRYKSSQYGLRPYVEISLQEAAEGSQSSAIAEVIIGSNNYTSEEVVEAFLAANRFTAARVTRSKCEFR